MNKNILIVDDEQNIRELIRYNLEAEGFKVWEAEDGEKVLNMDCSGIDLIILDLMLPGVDGLTVCRRLRDREGGYKIPIIMLTARGEEIDRVLGLEMGADDYITKPFSPRELVARVKAIFRRIDNTENESEDHRNNTYRQGDIELNIVSHEVKKEGDVLQLTPKEFELLKLLMANINRVLKRELLLEKIWGYDYNGDTRTVDVHIRRLRKKIGEDYITTIRGVGYKFVKVE
ncbi:MAG: response regulator [Halanaerobiales bacterium]